MIFFLHIVAIIRIFFSVSALHGTINDRFVHIAYQDDHTRFSDTLKIHGTFHQSGYSGKTYIKLFYTEGRDYSIFDSAKIENDQFHFVLGDFIAGIYRIGFSDAENELGEIILNPKEKEIHIVISRNDFVNGLNPGNSVENKAFIEYRQAKTVFEKQLTETRRSPVAKEEKIKAIRETERKIKTMQDAKSGEYPGTYFSKMVKAMISPQRFDKEKYWDDIDFKDVSLIRSRVFPDRIEDYMRIHGSAGNKPDNKTAGFYQAVDKIAGIMQKKANDTLKEFVFYVMAEGFFSSNMEDLSLYILSNYFYGEQCGDTNISSFFRTKAEGIKNLVPGNKPPDFIISNDKGEPVRFYDIAGKQKYTLVFFWSSTCQSCKAEIPPLLNLYSKYKNKGLEIFGISLDFDRKSWIDAIIQNKIVWLNGSELNGWQGKISKMYRVSATPVMFLCDHNNKLILKTKTTAQIEIYLNKYLK